MEVLLQTKTTVLVTVSQGDRKRTVLLFSLQKIIIMIGNLIGGVRHNKYFVTENQHID